VPPSFSGWLLILGPDSRDPDGIPDLFPIPGWTYSAPEFSWSEPIAVAGIAIPDGGALGPAYDGHVLIGDAQVGLGFLYALPLKATRDGFALSAFAAPDMSRAALKSNPSRMLPRAWGGRSAAPVGCPSGSSRWRRP
jgi:hypothetical protein